MTDESPPRRLSQIFDPLTSLSDLEQIQQQIQQHQQHLQQQNHLKYGPGGPSNSSSSSTLLQLQHQFHQSGSGGGGYNYNTASSSTSLSSASNQSAKLSSSSSTSSYIGGPPPGLNRIVMGSRSTPNSPRMMSRRGVAGGASANSTNSSRPPMVPPRGPPNAAVIANPSLVALDSDAPWPPFGSLTDSLDVHQVNNYHQGLPEVKSKHHMSAYLVITVVSNCRLIGRSGVWSCSSSCIGRGTRPAEFEICCVKR